MEKLVSRKLVNTAVLLLTVLSVVALEACSDASDSTEPATSGSEIFIRGVPMGKVRSLGWSPNHTAEYDAAVRKFATLDACLVGNPDDAGSLTIDWTKISSSPEAEVCLSRVASSIGTAKGIVLWLGTHGFRVVGVRKADEGDTSREAIERAGAVIDGVWSIGTNGPLYRGGVIAPLMQRLFAYGASVTIFLSRNERIVSVQAGVTYE